MEAPARSAFHRSQSYGYIEGGCAFGVSSAQRDLCAFHASEVPFVFGQIGNTDGNGDRFPRNWPVPDSREDNALATAMVDYWASFAKTGTPQSATGPIWRPYGQQEAYMRFNKRPLDETNPLPGMYEMQEEFVRHRRAAGQQWFLNVGVNAR